MESAQFPSQASEEFVVRYVADLNERAHDDPDVAEVSHYIRRFQGYRLEQVPLSDIFFENGSYSESLANTYADMPAPQAPPIVLDGITMVPADGFHRTNAARLRGDTHVLAYVGHTPCANWEPYEPDAVQRFRNSARLHKQLLSSLPPKSKEHTQPPVKLWVDQASSLIQQGVDVEYVDATGMTLLGAAVQGVLQHRTTEVVEALLALGADPNRLSRFPNRVGRHSAWEEVLRFHHPNPTLYDPEHELPSSLLEAFLANGLDLKRPAHDRAVAQWLDQKKGVHADSAPAPTLERMWRQARLEGTLPSRQNIVCRPRM